MGSMNKGILSDDSINIMNTTVGLFKTNTIESRSWETIDAAITACRELLFLMRSPVTGHGFNGLDDSTGIVKRFYNETVGFILGERRTINIQVWEGIVNDITDYTGKRSWQTLLGSEGSIGAHLDYFAKPPSTYKVASSNFKDTGIRDDLLLYAHHDILHKWIHRPNGIDDMLFSLVLMAKIYSVYKYSSLKG